MVWPWVIVGLVAVFLVVDQAFIYPRLVRRGQAARAAHGGRHTVWWWAGVAVVVVIGVFLVIVQLTK